MAQDDGALRRAGRGGFAVLGAKVFFIVASFVQQLALQSILKLAGYGALSRVLGAANIVNNVVIASSTQGVSRVVSRAAGDERRALGAVLRVHVVIAVLAGAAFAAAAPLVVYAEKAPHILLPLVVASLVVVAYGVYGPLVGSLNGRRMFGRQAALDVTFAVLRTAGLLGCAWFFQRHGGRGVLGAILGFVLAAALIVPLAARAAVGRHVGSPGFSAAIAPSASAPPPRARAYLSELWPLAAAQLATNVLMQLDFNVLAAFLSHAATSALPAADAARVADEWAGVYRSCQLFAFLPYQLTVSVTQILFPMVARAHAAGDAAAVRAYVERGGRIGAATCGLVVAIVVTLPGALLRFGFGRDVASRGEGTLRILSLGQGTFAILAIAATVLASLDRERTAARITSIATAAVAVAAVAAGALAPFGEAQLRATALGTTLALVAALAVAVVAVRNVARAFVPLATAVRVAGAVAVLAVAGVFVPPLPKLATPLLAAAVAVAYVALLYVTREIGAADLDALKTVLRRRVSDGKSTLRSAG